MDAHTFAELTAPAGQALLAEVARGAGSESDLALGTRLRRDHPAELVAAAVTQHHLRRRAVTKFGADAELLYFTPDALEQSTRAPVAAHRASRLAALGATRLVDLGCGIGGDLIAAARAGLEVRGVELDPVRAAIARANLAALGLAGTVEVGDATTTPIGADEVAFVDPARRDGAGRTFRLDALVPSWDFAIGLLEGRAVAKVMPGIAHDAVPPGVQAEWVSHGGDLVEASLWGAGFGQDPARRATVLPRGATLVGRGARAHVGDALSHLVEPDDAVIRAGLVAELAEDLGGHLLDPRIAWITTDSPAATPLGRAFRVVEELPFREKQLRAALRERDIGTLTIKKRGVDVVPERLVARLKLTGTRTATVVLTRVADEARAFLVERER
ncbi:SAM-dependent methyltransferase [Aeromicrobium sp. Marseille-Q0843]|uniref:SAM-dependent methyltransferase n=1 Tax=Aeromicrobium phoceense TaxID=2754045 RepID=A0A838XH36_9ACTN|nr:SAM-dependent methyltransferase [Aeromicrobium phoceense]